LLCEIKGDVTAKVVPSITRQIAVEAERDRYKRLAVDRDCERRFLCFHGAQH